MVNKSAKRKTSKKQTSRGKAASKSRNRPNHSHWLRKLLVRLSIALLVIGGIYYFSSFEIRAKMERVALSIINTPRTHGAMPTLITPIFDSLYDTIPSSGGMVVEGGELGRDQDSPFLAGIPNCRMPIRTLLQSSYINLFNERNQQSACIAIRLDNTKRKKANTGDSLQIDAQLATNFAPMTETYAEGVWRKVMHEFTQRYPKRFGEVWVYLGTPI